MNKVVLMFLLHVTDVGKWTYHVERLVGNLFCSNHLSLFLKSPRQLGGDPLVKSKAGMFLAYKRS